jgi:hypothetical protein
MAQADTLARELGLSAADRLLDLGTGRGWPGAVPGRQDRLPGRPRRPALGRTARGRQPRRQRSPRRPHRRGGRRGSGLPFLAGSFDAVIHTDVLC